MNVTQNNVANYRKLVSVLETGGLSHDKAIECLEDAREHSNYGVSVLEEALSSVNGRSVSHYDFEPLAGSDGSLDSAYNLVRPSCIVGAIISYDQIMEDFAQNPDKNILTYVWGNSIVREHIGREDHQLAYLQANAPFTSE